MQPAASVWLLLHRLPPPPQRRIDQIDESERSAVEALELTRRSTKRRTVVRAGAAVGRVDTLTARSVARNERRTGHSTGRASYDCCNGVDTPIASSNATDDATDDAAVKSIKSHESAQSVLRLRT